MDKHTYYQSEIERLKQRIEFRIEEIEEEKSKIKESEKIIEIAKEDIQTFKDVCSELTNLYNSQNK